MPALTRIIRLLLIAALLTLFISGCASTPPTHPVTPSAASGDPIGTLLANHSTRNSPVLPNALETMGHTIQVGAFASLENAVRLEHRLEAAGVEAYYFRHASGLYKVRFGNHAHYRTARAQAEALQRRGLFRTFFIVRPTDHPTHRMQREGTDGLRRELVTTARRFLGTPYRWGGEDAANGFDCSGLTMVTYRLNGLNLPRNSRSQYRAGRWVGKSDLRAGDLVFFATKGGSRVTHVGIYAGNDRFIHAPRTGKTVRVESLSNPFFARTYVGGRSYL